MSELRRLRHALDFFLYDWLNVTRLCNRERFTAHSRDTFDAVLDTCERIARDKYAPFNRLVDTQEPAAVPDEQGGLRVVLPQATHDAWRAYAESGLLAAAQDEAWGGMQLPYTIEAAANACFAHASVSISAGMLTTGNANLLMAHGTPKQRKVFAAQEFAGIWSGTMCLSEPQAGSSLSDISTRAVPDGEDHDSDPLGPRYRLRGNKMWISAGEHDLTDNIIHLVLAKIPEANGQLPTGVKGISLFIVPKKLVTANGELCGLRNDVALAGLNHKCGWRGTTNTLLNFGEGTYRVMPDAAADANIPVGAGLDGQGTGAVGYLVGQAGQGLACMFHMMNEARIGVGMAATMLGMAGYHASLNYAQTRTQGRPIGVGGKNSRQQPVRIIEHTDVRRMLLAQKAYAEGALALELYCARLVDDTHTAPDAATVDDARLLLEVLTPIAKSWPSEWCLEANSLAIQVHGGYGYTRDFPVEQYWRDNRLNMIHEGTHGIQALDLLGRKVLMEQGKGLQLWTAKVRASIAQARQLTPSSSVPSGIDVQTYADQLEAALSHLLQATQSAWGDGVPAHALANAVPYLQAFGHTVLAWLWLDVSCAILQPTQTAPTSLPDANLGRLFAMAYFFEYELPKIKAWLGVVERRTQTCANMPEAAF